jgi:nitrate/nitrite transporter NarK
MDAKLAWPMIGLAFGTALGFAGAFGGFGTFVIVLLLGVVGLLAGRAMSGDLDVGEIVDSFGARKGTPGKGAR